MIISSRKSFLFGQLFENLGLFIFFSLPIITKELLKVQEAIFKTLPKKISKESFGIPKLRGDWLTDE